MELFVSDNILPDGLLHVHKASYYDNLCNEYEVSLRWRPYCTNRTFSTDSDELVQVVGYRVRVWPSRSRKGPIHLYYSTCRAVVLPDPAGRAGSMGSFLARLPSRFVGKHRQTCRCSWANIRLLHDTQMLHCQHKRARITSSARTTMRQRMRPWCTRLWAAANLPESMSRHGWRTSLTTFTSTTTTTVLTLPTSCRPAWSPKVF